MAIKRKDPGAEEQCTSGVGGAVSAGGSKPAGGVGRSGGEEARSGAERPPAQQGQKESPGAHGKQQGGRTGPAGQQNPGK